MTDAERKKLEEAMNRAQKRLNEFEKTEARLKKKYGSPKKRKLLSPAKKKTKAKPAKPKYLGKTATATAKMLDKVDD